MLSGVYTACEAAQYNGFLLFISFVKAVIFAWCIKSYSALSFGTSPAHIARISQLHQVQSPAEAYACVYTQYSHIITAIRFYKNFDY